MSSTKPFQKTFYSSAGKCLALSRVLGFDSTPPPLFHLFRNNLHFREWCLNFLFLVCLGSCVILSGFFVVVVFYMFPQSGKCIFFSLLKKRKANIPSELLKWGISFEFPAPLPWTPGFPWADLAAYWNSAELNYQQMWTPFRVQLNHTHCASSRWKLLLTWFILVEEPRGWGDTWVRMWKDLPEGFLCWAV